MECDRVREDIAGQWGSGESLSEAVQRHLGSCEACRREALIIEEILESTVASPVPDPGKEYWDSFLPAVRARLDHGGANLAERPAAGRFRQALTRLSGRRLFPSLAAAAAIAVVAVSVWYLLISASPAPGIDAELDPIRAELDARMKSTNLEILVETVESLSPEDSADRDSQALTSNSLPGDFDPDAASAAVGAATALLSPADFGGWAGIVAMTEDLTTTQKKALKAALAREEEKG